MASKSTSKKTTNTTKSASAKTAPKKTTSSKASKENTAPKTSSAPVKNTKAPAKKTAPAKKSPSKKTTSSKATATKQSPAATETVRQDTATTTATPTSALKQVRVRKVYILTALIIVILGFALYYYRSLFVAAVVNGQPISRLSIVQAAEKQSGKQALDTQVRNILIEQEAKKEGVTVSDKEVDDQMKSVETKLKSQGQNIDQVLAMQGMTKNDLRSLMRLDKLVQKMVGKNVKVTDKQVDDYINANKDSLPQNEDEKKLRDTVKAQLEQQELQQQVQTWLTNLQSKAKILYFVQY
jgi:hypothetical protein